MKAGWQRKRIGDLCEIIAGQSPEGAFYNADGKGMPFYQGKKEFGEKYIDDPTSWTTQTTKVAREGDVLMSVRAPVGPVNFSTGEICIGRGLAAIRSGPELNREFLFYQLLHLQPTIAGREGAVFPSINRSEIEALPIAVPTLSDQKRIVDILDAAFGGIAAAKSNAEKNLHNARALFENYLRSVVGDAWRTYELVTLSDLATDITDGDHLPPPKKPAGIPFITIGNIVKETHEIDFTNTFTVSRSYFAGLKATKKPMKGDVLYTVTGSFGIPVIVRENITFCFQRHIGLIRPKSETNSVWLYYLLLSPQVFQQANAGATGAAQRTVSLKLLRNLVVPNVTRPQQLAAVAKLDAMSSETQRLAALYERKCAALDELKSALLNQAFIGDL